MDGSSQDAVSSFQPSLAVVIGVLCIMFFFTFILLVYAKFCHRRDPNGDPNTFVLVRSGSRYSGIEESVIQSLPLFRFSSLKGSKEGLECAVCLSKFEEIEVLRLLPKCKHAFHISCVDKWLEKHSSCPLCRTKVSADDLAVFAYSNSMRFSSNQSELFVQREESRPNSSRFSSFRLVEKAISVDEEALMGKEEGQEGVFDKFKHRIIVSGSGFDGRWSSVSASDLTFLSSEMINNVSSNRFELSSSEKLEKIKEELEMKRLFEEKISHASTSESGGVGRNIVNSGDRRSVSEISGLSRFGGNNRGGRGERLRGIWLPIARNGVDWFAHRERRSQGENENDDGENRRHALHV